MPAAPVNDRADLVKEDMGVCFVPTLDRSDMRRDPVQVDADNHALGGTAEVNALEKVYSHADDNGAIDSPVRLARRRGGDVRAVRILELFQAICSQKVVSLFSSSKLNG